MKKRKIWLALMPVLVAGTMITSAYATWFFNEVTLKDASGTGVVDGYYALEGFKYKLTNGNAEVASVDASSGLTYSIHLDQPTQGDANDSARHTTNGIYFTYGDSAAVFDTLSFVYTQSTAVASNVSYTVSWNATLTNNSSYLKAETTSGSSTLTLSTSISSSTDTTVISITMANTISPDGEYNKEMTKSEYNTMVTTYNDTNFTQTISFTVAATASSNTSSN